ncbi:hypothetical protein F5Y10DRAFT_231032 [Nemania abortiva]|nr:hypothetical protein F5Y10DRAFT_231032 [Nemania abortiva]
MRQFDWSSSKPPCARLTFCFHFHFHFAVSLLPPLLMTAQRYHSQNKPRQSILQASLSFLWPESPFGLLVAARLSYSSLGRQGRFLLLSTQTNRSARSLANTAVQPNDYRPLLPAAVLLQALPINRISAFSFQCSGDCKVALPTPRTCHHAPSYSQESRNDRIDNMEPPAKRSDQAN